MTLVVPGFGYHEYTKKGSAKLDQDHSRSSHHEEPYESTSRSKKSYKRKEEFEPTRPSLDEESRYSTPALPLGADYVTLASWPSMEMPNIVTSIPKISKKISKADIAESTVEPSAPLPPSDMKIPEMDLSTPKPSKQPATMILEEEEEIPLGTFDESYTRRPELYRDLDTPDEAEIDKRRATWLLYEIRAGIKESPAKVGNIGKSANTFLTAASDHYLEILMKDGKKPLWVHRLRITAAAGPIQRAARIKEYNDIKAEGKPTAGIDLERIFPGYKKK